MHLLISLLTLLSLPLSHAETPSSGGASPAPVAASAPTTTVDADLEGLKKVHYGRICGTSCNGDVGQVAIFNEQGKCVFSHAYPCFPYSCDDKTRTCKQKCETNADCSAGSVCNDAKGACTPLTYTCKNGQTVLASSGQESSCAPYSCVAGSCKESCTSQAQCAEGHTCKDERCVAK